MKTVRKAKLDYALTILHFHLDELFDLSFEAVFAELQYLINQPGCRPFRWFLMNVEF